MPVLAAIVAASTALAIPVASVRAVSCDRAAAMVGSVRPEAAIDASMVAATDVASAFDDDRGTCLGALALAPAFAHDVPPPREPSEVSRARDHTRGWLLHPGLERPPRHA